MNLEVGFYKKGAWLVVASTLACVWERSNAHERALAQLII